MIKRPKIKGLGKKLVCSIAVLALSIAPMCGPAFGSQSVVQSVYTSQSVEQSARNAIASFFDGIINNDFNEMMANSIDNVIAPSVRHDVFNRRANDFIKYEILSIKAVDSTHALAKVRVYEKNVPGHPSGQLTFEYSIVFNGAKWMVDITKAHAEESPSVPLVTLNPNSQDPHRQSVVPNTTTAQYDGSVLNSQGWDLLVYNVPVWDDPSVAGYQYVSSGNAPQVEYQLDELVNGGTVPISNIVTETGNFPSTNWFSAAQFQPAYFGQLYLMGYWVNQGSFNKIYAAGDFYYS